MLRWVYVAVAVGIAVASTSTPALAAPSPLQQLEADCLAGDGFACKRWGTRLNMRYPGPPQPVKARAAFEKGCALKDSDACAFLYQMLALGEGGAASRRAYRAWCRSRP